MPFLDQPALVPSLNDPPGGRPVERQGSEVWVRFLDGTIRSCRVIEWRQDKLGWWCKLGWGVSGRPMEQWYRYDQAKVQPTAIRRPGSEAPTPPGQA